MRGYAWHEIFTAEEIRLRAAAARLVEALPYQLGNKPLRCHEVARAVGHMLGLQAVDGWFGMVEHSWLWATPFVPLSPLPNVLDPYRPGCHPQVLLLHSSSHLPFDYRRGDPRKDVRHAVVRRLIKILGGS